MNLDWRWGTGRRGGRRTSGWWEAASGKVPAASARRVALLASVLLLVTAFRMHAADLDAGDLLRRSDQARGGGLPGLVWTVYLENTGGDAAQQPAMTVAAEAIESASIAIVQAPANRRGWTMLQVERNMWLTKPSLKKPVPISPRQRLTGEVAVGDIAATNYAKEYAASYLGDEVLDGESCRVLDLKAKTNRTTYDRIRYWVSVARTVALRADFMSLSGKRIKSATFIYDNTIAGPKGPILFVSRMEIADALTDGRSRLDYRDVAVKSIPAGRFDPDNL